jgi:hypothetical protein
MGGSSGKGWIATERKPAEERVDRALSSQPPNAAAPIFIRFVKSSDHPSVE